MVCGSHRKCVSVASKLSPRPFEAKNPLLDWGSDTRNRLIWVILIEVFTSRFALLSHWWLMTDDPIWWRCLYLCLSIIASADTGYLSQARQHNNYTISSHHSNQCLPSAIKKNISQLFNIQDKQSFSWIWIIKWKYWRWKPRL